MRILAREPNHAECPGRGRCAGSRNPPLPVCRSWLIALPVLPKEWLMLGAVPPATVGCVFFFFLALRWSSNYAGK